MERDYLKIIFDNLSFDINTLILLSNELKKMIELYEKIKFKRIKKLMVNDKLFLRLKEQNPNIEEDIPNIDTYYNSLDDEFYYEVQDLDSNKTYTFKYNKDFCKTCSFVVSIIDGLTIHEFGLIKTGKMHWAEFALTYVNNKEVSRRSYFVSALTSLDDLNSICSLAKDYFNEKDINKKNIIIANAEKVYCLLYKDIDETPKLSKEQFDKLFIRLANNYDENEIKNNNPFERTFDEKYDKNEIMSPIFTENFDFAFKSIGLANNLDLNQFMPKVDEYNKIISKVFGNCEEIVLSKKFAGTALLLHEENMPIEFTTFIIGKNVNDYILGMVILSNEKLMIVPYNISEKQAQRMFLKSPVNKESQQLKDFFNIDENYRSR